MRDQLTLHNERHLKLWCALSLDVATSHNQAITDGTSTSNVDGTYSMTDLTKITYFTVRKTAKPQRTFFIITILSLMQMTHRVRVSTSSPTTTDADRTCNTGRSPMATGSCEKGMWPAAAAVGLDTCGVVRKDRSTTAPEILAALPPTSITTLGAWGGKRGGKKSRGSNKTPLLHM